MSAPSGALGEGFGQAFARRGCQKWQPLTTTLTEAFAQQAYTAIGNRDREIMRDPYMLGFEIVTKNEENTRLVGAFAFRVGDEILLAPVFYLNVRSRVRTCCIGRG